MSRFTMEELASCRGADGGPLHIAVRGDVYDVGSARDFYGPDGPYHAFAGRECSRALALMKVEVKECNDRLEDLDEKAMKVLDDWIKKFNAKYPIVGQVVK
ncbi:unnamed protein product [Ostreobium quekettii]|uniref:Cytochrome b5 heme-binding domain-containing protein n=1 Tax=Ostreobium quekettii TaxID=121088 RepID=A0A8S1IV78_9CHLO|nr:unnamed protein product [Ostreobium quekettii]|eukprot:evm.model.scf_1012.2 EVM.evm.TU.scf_1012.2   scf_1012:8373-11472(-)